MIIRVIDFETCGFPPDNGQIVEVATLDLVQGDDGKWARGRQWSTLVNPGRPIPPEASAVHHITDDDVKDAPPWADTAVQGPLIEGLGDVPFCFAAHHAKFERACWTNTFRWVCTHKVGVTLWPECPSHSNQCLRYFLGLKLADPALAVPHRAAGDVYVTGAILRRALIEFVVTVEELIAISDRAALLPRLHFGEHAGKPIADVPTSYLEWIIKPGKREPFDEDVLWTARSQLHERRNAQRARSPVQVEEGR